MSQTGKFLNGRGTKDTMEILAKAMSGQGAIGTTAITNPDIDAIWDSAGLLGNGVSTLPVNLGGTGATSAANARANLDITPGNIGAVAKSGDTMTGRLTVNNTDPIVRLMNSGWDTSATSATSNTYSTFALKDKNDRYLGYLQGLSKTDGSSVMSLGARKYLDSANVTNELVLTVKADKTKSVSLSDPAAGRSALSISDYVSAQGKSGNGNYIKYASGYCMMGCSQTVSVPVANGGKLGDWWVAAVASVSYPFTITSENNRTVGVSCSDQAISAGIMLNSGLDGGNGKTPTYLLNRPTQPAVAATFVVYHQIFGKGK